MSLDEAEVIVVAFSLGWLFSAMLRRNEESATTPQSEPPDRRNVVRERNTEET
jgi:hypothetical protein